MQDAKKEYDRCVTKLGRLSELRGRLREEFENEREMRKWQAEKDELEGEQEELKAEKNEWKEQVQELQCALVAITTATARKQTKASIACVTRSHVDQ